MKTLEQVLGFIEGWELAISTDDEELDKDNQVLNTLKEIWAYACIPLDSTDDKASVTQREVEAVRKAAKTTLMNYEIASKVNEALLKRNWWQRLLNINNYEESIRKEIESKYK